MQISLRSPLRRALFGALVLACTCFYVRSAIQTYVAYRASTRTTAAGLRRAIALQPGNSDYHHRLGLTYLFVEQDIDAATREYRAAVALNPHVAKYWLDLAEAYNTSGNAQELEAIRRAVEAEPTRPAIAWEAANLYLVQGNTAEALRLLRIVLNSDPHAYGLRAIDTSWRATHDARLIMREVLPPSPTMYATLLQLLIEQDRPEDAATVWAGLAGLGQRFDPVIVFPYFDYEIKNQRADSAEKVWEYVARMAGVEAGDRGGNLVFNSGFDRDLLNGGFDWRFSRATHVQADLDTTDLHGGNRSLMLVFDGEPWSEAGVYQFISVVPNASYRFSAFEKAYELLTPSGPRFRITDAYTGATLFESSDVLGSTVWSEVSGDFITGPDTRILKLAIVRNPSFQRISGKFWVDDVKITKP